MADLCCDGDGTRGLYPFALLLHHSASGGASRTAALSLLQSIHTHRWPVSTLGPFSVCRIAAILFPWFLFLLFLFTIPLQLIDTSASKQAPQCKVPSDQ